MVAAREFHIVEAVICRQVEMRRWTPDRPEGHGGLPSIEELPAFNGYVGSKPITLGCRVLESSCREAVDPCPSGTALPPGRANDDSRFSSRHRTERPDCSSMPNHMKKQLSAS